MNYLELGTFSVAVPNGTYNVTVTLGDTAGPATGHDQMGVFLEGSQVASVTTAQAQVVSNTYSVTVSDGRLDLLLDDLGGANLYVTILGLDVVSATGGGGSLRSSLASTGENSYATSDTVVLDAAADSAPLMLDVTSQAESFIPTADQVTQAMSGGTVAFRHSRPRQRPSTSNLHAANIADAFFARIAAADGSFDEHLVDHLGTAPAAPHETRDGMADALLDSLFSEAKSPFWDDGD